MSFTTTLTAFEHEIEVTYNASKGYPATWDCPAEPAELEIEEISGPGADMLYQIGDQFPDVWLHLHDLLEKHLADQQ